MRSNNKSYLVSQAMVLAKKKNIKAPYFKSMSVE